MGFFVYSPSSPVYLFVQCDLSVCLPSQSCHACHRPYLRPRYWCWCCCCRWWAGGGVGLWEAFSKSLGMSTEKTRSISYTMLLSSLENLRRSFTSRSRERNLATSGKSPRGRPYRLLFQQQQQQSRRRRRIIRRAVEGRSVGRQVSACMHVERVCLPRPVRPPFPRSVPPPTPAAMEEAQPHRAQATNSRSRLAMSLSCFSVLPNTVGTCFRR